MLKDLKEEILSFNSNINEECFETLASNRNFKYYNDKFIDFVDNLNVQGGELAQYWLSFLQMAQILLNIIYATITLTVQGTTMFCLYT